MLDKSLDWKRVYVRFDRVKLYNTNVRQNYSVVSTFFYILKYFTLLGTQSVLLISSRKINRPTNIVFAEHFGVH